MKLAIASDLHLEFDDINLKNDMNADVLILAGDIMIAEDLYKFPVTAEKTDSFRQIDAQIYRDFMKRVSFQFPQVVCIAGNHEFYRGEWVKSLQDLRNEYGKFPNIHFLENEVFVLDDITFIGCTLWTDMNKADPITLHTVHGMLNDYCSIKHDGLGYTKIRPAHTVSRHRRSVEYIRTVTEGLFDQKFVVVGHHAPSKLSTHAEYKDNHILNAAYSSDLSELILDHPQIKLWVHGHTHKPFDYMIGDTRVVCNPRGYAGYEMQANNFQLKVIDL